MVRLIVLAGVCVLMAWGQKKPVTLEVMHAQPAFAELAGMEWSGDGARFAWIAGGQVKVYDVAGRAERSLAALGPMEGAAAAMVEADAFGWQNRRVKEKALQWSGDGKKLLLKVKGDLFLVDTAAGEWR
ncbi:MAG: hypothetical protein J0L64_15675, partial [Acidobacteria bacterium]|nr:hypothetical protein [Acidobacteriota bacterium]